MFSFFNLLCYIRIHKYKQTLDTGNTLIYPYSFDGPTYTNIALYICEKPTDHIKCLLCPFDRLTNPINRPIGLSND